MIRLPIDKLRTETVINLLNGSNNCCYSSSKYYFVSIRVQQFVFPKPNTSSS